MRGLCSSLTSLGIQQPLNEVMPNSLRASCKPLVGFPRQAARRSSRPRFTPQRSGRLPDCNLEAGHLEAELDSWTVFLYNNAIAQTLAVLAMRFTDTKSETLNLRVSPTFKQVLREVADNEQRSMVNMLEVLLGNYCESKGIATPDRKTTSPVQKRTHAHRRAHVRSGV